MRIAAALTLAAIAAAAFFAKSAKADVVDSLVYNNSPDRTVILFDGTGIAGRPTSAASATACWSSATAAAPRRPARAR